jgi:hypothetical protein
VNKGKTKFLVIYRREIPMKLGIGNETYWKEGDDSTPIRRILNDLKDECSAQMWITGMNFNWEDKIFGTILH